MLDAVSWPRSSWRPWRVSGAAAAAPGRSAGFQPWPGRQRAPAGRALGELTEWPDRPAPAVGLGHRQPHRVKEIRSARGARSTTCCSRRSPAGSVICWRHVASSPTGLVVRSLVPVSVRSENERGLIANRVSAVLANLPVGEPDPMRRLALLREPDGRSQAHPPGDRRRDPHRDAGVRRANAARAGFPGRIQIPQPLVQTVTTNVPGPRFPLFLLGRRMVRMYPYVPIGNNVRIGVAIISYLDRFSFGITADYTPCPIWRPGQGHPPWPGRASGPVVGRPPRRRPGRGRTPRRPGQGRTPRRPGQGRTPRHPGRGQRPRRRPGPAPRRRPVPPGRLSAGGGPPRGQLIHRSPGYRHVMGSAAGG